MIAAVGFSAYQYATTGSVTWVATTWHKVRTTLGDYATRPEAGWRRAADAIEDLGAAREAAPRRFDITGKVENVVDGDTVTILTAAGKHMRVDLYGIDAPERGQPYDTEASRALATLVAGKAAGVSVVETGGVGGPVGIIHINDENINLAMVAGGHAWWYAKQARYELTFKQAERQARASKIGLWANPAAVAPWEWRRQ